MRQLPNSVRYAILGMVAQNRRGVHGYALKRQCDRVLGHFWQLDFGETYRVLGQLAGDRWIKETVGRPGSNRKTYQVTPEGLERLNAFILQPPTDLPRPLRQELAVKLLFAPPERLPEVVRMFDSQRTIYMEELHRLAIQRRKLRPLPVDDHAVGLLIDGAEMSVRAELAWLEHVCQRLQERLGASAA